MPVSVGNSMSAPRKMSARRGLSFQLALPVPVLFTLISAKVWTMGAASPQPTPISGLPYTSSGVIVKVGFWRRQVPVPLAHGPQTAAKRLAGAVTEAGTLTVAPGLGNTTTSGATDWPP